MTGPSDQSTAAQDHSASVEQGVGLGHRATWGNRIGELYGTIDPPIPPDAASPGALGNQEGRRSGGSPEPVRSGSAADDSGGVPDRDRRVDSNPATRNQHENLTTIYTNIEPPRDPEQTREASEADQSPPEQTGETEQAEQQVEEPERLIAARARELQDMVPEGARGRITMSNGSGLDENGAERIVVGTSEPRGYLRPGVILNDNEELATAPGHAEVSVLAYMQDKGITARYVGAGRPICDNCADSIEQAGAVAVTEYKNPNRARNL